MQVLSCRSRMRGMRVLFEGKDSREWPHSGHVDEILRQGL